MSNESEKGFCAWFLVSEDGSFYMDRLSHRMNVYPTEYIALEEARKLNLSAVPKRFLCIPAKMDVCPECEGHGMILNYGGDEDIAECPTCKGTGEIPMDVARDQLTHPTTTSTKGCLNCKHYHKSLAFGTWKATCGNKQFGCRGVICQGTWGFHNDDHMNAYCACYESKGYEPREEWSCLRG